jgi:hypothetical protein
MVKFSSSKDFRKISIVNGSKNWFVPSGARLEGTLARLLVEMD